MCSMHWHMWKIPKHKRFFNHKISGWVCCCGWTLYWGLTLNKHFCPIALKARSVSRVTLWIGTATSDGKFAGEDSSFHLLLGISRHNCRASFSPFWSIVSVLNYKGFQRSHWIPPWALNGLNGSIQCSMLSSLHIMRMNAARGRGWNDARTVTPCVSFLEKRRSCHYININLIFMTYM